MKNQVQFRCDHRILVERLELRLILWFGGVPLVLERRRNDQLVHQWVCHARDLYERSVLVRRLTRLAQQSVPFSRPSVLPRCSHSCAASKTLSDDLSGLWTPRATSPCVSTSQTCAALRVL